MYHCPHCREELKRERSRHGVFWRCAACGSRGAKMSFLRRDVDREMANAIWNLAHDGEARTARSCPICTRAMAGVSVTSRGAHVGLDVCKLCQRVWFDPGEYGMLPATPTPPEEPKLAELPAEVRRAYMELKLQEVDRARHADAFTPSFPEESWKFWVGLLGIPIETDSWGVDRRPWITWSTGLLMILATALTQWVGPSIYESFGFIPALAFGEPIRWVTAFFLHGGWIHCLGNLYFLLVFGDNVEDELGHGSFALLLAGATAFGDVVHTLVAPDLDMPAVGASGGISGVIACYAVLLPRAKLSMRVVIFWISLPAWAMFGVWVVFQLLGTFDQAQGLSLVSAGAHLGGAVVGLLFGGACRLRRARG